MQNRTEYRRIKREGQLLLPKELAQDFSVRVPIELYQQIRQAAIDAEQSQTRFVYELLQLGIDKYKRQNAA